MQIGHPLLLFPLSLVLIYRAGQRLAKRKARKEKQVKSGFAAPMNAMPPTAGTQFFEVCLSAQPVGDFWIWSAVCDGQPPVLGELTALPGNSSLSAFSFVPCPARFLFGKTKRKCGGHSDGQSPSSGGKAAHRYMPTVTAIRFPAASRPPTGVLPRKRAASSATGGAWPAFPSGSREQGTHPLACSSIF